MAQALHQPQHPAVYIEGEELVLAEFREMDPDVVALAKDAEEEIEPAVHRILQVGARALRAAEASVDTAVVEKAFGEMTTEFDRKLTEVVEDIQEVGKDLLDDEEGELRVALNGWKDQVEQLLDDVFDVDSKKSVIGKLERILEAAGKDQVAAVRRLIDADNDDSPLRRWRSEIVKTVEDRTGEIHKAVQDLSEKIAVRDAEGRVLELTAVKGFSFEDAVHSVVGNMAAPHGDAAEKTGRTTGILGNQTGDEVVHLNTDDTNDEPARFVFEIKDRKVGLKGILDEIEEAMENREALAGIAVFSRQANAPTSVPFQPYGTKAIVVFDKDELDPRALDLAYMWARWIVRRQLAAGSAEVDFGRVDECLATALMALRRASTVRRAHTAAKNKIDEANSALGHLEAEVDQAIQRVRDELCKAESSE